MSATTDRPARVQVIALNDLGVLQRETGDYSAAEASHQQALQMFRDQGNRLGQAEALNRLGELSCRTSATDQAHERHVRALTIAGTSAYPSKKRAPWKDLAWPTSTTATPGKPPRTSGRHSVSTSVSEPTLRSASKTPCAYTGQIKPHLNPATTNYFDLKKSEG